MTLCPFWDSTGGPRCLARSRKHFTQMCCLLSTQTR